MPKLVVKTNYDIMGSFLHASTGTMYEDNIPELTRVNIAAVGNAILNYQATKEAFYDHLVNKITLQLFNQFIAENKFKFLKGMMVNGDIEDSYVDYINGENFDPTNENPFRVTKGEMKTLYHKRDRELTYTISISDAQIRRAFLSEGGLQTLINQKVNSLYESAELDEYVMVKGMIAHNFTKAGKVVTLEGTTHQDIVTNLLYNLKKYSKDISYANRTHNNMEVMNRTPLDEQVVVLHKDYALDIDMGILANTYNMEKLAIQTQVVEVDDFNADANRIVAAIMDRRGFRLHDVVRTTEAIRNPANLTTTYWFHLWQIVSYAYFMNTVYFVEPETVVEGTAVVDVNIVNSEEAPVNTKEVTVTP